MAKAERVKNNMLSVNLYLIYLYLHIHTPGNHLERDTAFFKLPNSKTHFFYKMMPTRTLITNKLLWLLLLLYEVR